MSAQSKQRAEEYKDHVKKIHESLQKILYGEPDLPHYDHILNTEEIINFKKLIMEYFQNYHSNHLYNHVVKSKYERSRISNCITTYCLKIKQRWLELEPLIITDDVFAIDYISKITQERMLEYEAILEKKLSPKKISSYLKATRRILPDKFHNVMLAYRLTNNRHAKTYFDVLSKIND